MVLWGPLERAVLAETNLARTNPVEYAKVLVAMRRHYRGDRYAPPGAVPLVTREGVAALDEAIAFLRATRPVPPLVPSGGLTHAARDHVADTGPAGLYGHVGSDGSKVDERVSRYGVWSGALGENIQYGGATAREVVANLIIDDGVPGRGHRALIFNPVYRWVGIASGPHAAISPMTVCDYATEFAEGR